MKKAITILAVLIVLVGAVFAETHTIRIKADVSEIEPVFGLRFGAVSSAEFVTNYDSADEYGVGNHTLGTDDAQIVGEYDAVDSGLDLNNGGSIDFYAMLLNEAKQLDVSYKLTFGGGDFVVTVNGGDPGTSDATIVVDENSFVSEDGIIDVTADQQDENSIHVAFLGGKVTSAANTLALAKATYRYTGNDEIDMLEEDHYYYADVTLTITIDN